MTKVAQIPYVYRVLLYLLLCWLHGSQQSSAQRFMPIVTNFSPYEYDAGLQNWSIGQGENGEIYVGNNMGLLFYDGFHWQKTLLPSNQPVRSLLACKDRIYVGTYQDFGYFKRDKFGFFEYTSLWKQLKNYTPHNDEIWSIVRTSDGHILFQSFCSWFDYDGKNVTAHYDERKLPFRFFEVRGKIYAQFINEDFCVLAQNKHPQKLLDHAQLGNSHVVSVIPMKDGDLLLFTESGGMFRYDGTCIAPFKTEISGRTIQTNKVVMSCRDSVIVVGTINDGVYGIDMDGKMKWHYDIHNRLRTNSVLNMICDQDGNVWLSLDVGVSVIHSGAPYELLLNPHNALGMVYDVYKQQDLLYIATNQHTYCVTPMEGVVSVAGTQGQNWYLQSFDNLLFVGNNWGLKTISGNHSAKMHNSPESGSTNLQKVMLNNGETYLLESSYNHLHIYRKEDEHWKFQNEVSGFSSPIRQFEIDEKGVIWAVHLHCGLSRIELNEDLRSVKKLNFWESIHNEKASRLFVMKILGEIVVSDGEMLYLLDQKNRQFKPFAALNDIVQGLHVVSATPAGPGTFWLSTDKAYLYLRFSNEKYQLLSQLSAAFFGLECSDINNRVRIFGEETYFCLNNGIGRMHQYGLERMKRKAGRKLLVTSAYYETAGHRKHYVEITQKPLPEVRRNLTLRLSYPNYEKESLQFHFILRKGKTTDLTVKNEPDITYENLKSGHYTVEINVLDGGGNVLDTTSFQFRCRQPLLISWPLLLFYAFSVIGLIYLFMKWRIGKNQKKMQEELQKEKKRKEEEITRQQQIIELQQKQLLEHELQEKGKELARLSMDKMAVNNDEYWEIYRKNFDLIHEGFFRKLRENYPSLTTTDLKFCALLRLNLNTKDIANFTGLSVRGVEGARYRIRKKLQLPEDVNLSEFFIEFK